MYIYKNSVHVELIDAILDQSMVQYHVCWIQGLSRYAAFLKLHYNPFFQCREARWGLLTGQMSGGQR